jgi:hypothetical protein
MGTLTKMEIALRIAAPLLLIGLLTSEIVFAEGGGDPVPGTGHEERCVAAIKAVGTGADVNLYFSNALILGPGIVQAMTGDQRKFPKGGTPALITAVFSGRRMFFMGRFVKGNDLEVLLSSERFKEMLRGVADGAARPATREERDLYYSLVPYEIEGKPVTVLQKGKRRLLVDGGDNLENAWLDMIDEYPLQSVAQSEEEAMNLIGTQNHGQIIEVQQPVPSKHMGISSLRSCTPCPLRPAVEDAPSRATLPE